MRLGFFVVVQTDVRHFLHASSLVREAGRRMPMVESVQLTDLKTPEVPGVAWMRRSAAAGPLLEQRLSHYANCVGEWLLIDTDVSLRNDVRGVFDDQVFDVALCDRNWPHSPQGEVMLQTMPFNTGVVFSRSVGFWGDVLDTWRRFSDADRGDWLSEQRAVYQVVRTGRYRVKILPGIHYNYPPRSVDDAPITAALVHFKGPRKAWLEEHARATLGR